VRTELRNTGASEVDFARAVPANSRRPRETGRQTPHARHGGLTPPTRIPHYLFLTRWTRQPPWRCRGLAHRRPRQRSVVLDRGGGKIRLRAHIDYGHLRIPGGASSRLETLALGFSTTPGSAWSRTRMPSALLRGEVADLRSPVTAPGIRTRMAAPPTRNPSWSWRVAARELKPFGFSFVQIDDKWQDGAERNARPAVLPGQARRPVSQRFAARQQTPDATRADHRSLFLPSQATRRTPNSKTGSTGSCAAGRQAVRDPWGNTSLDLTHPEVRDYLTAS